MGFERVRAYLLGRQDGTPKDVTRASKLSDIPADIIRDLALRMANSHTLICTAIGLQRAEFSEQLLWMTVILTIIPEQIGTAGAGYGIGYGVNASIGMTDRPVKYASENPGTLSTMGKHGNTNMPTHDRRTSRKSKNLKASCPR